MSTSTPLKHPPDPSGARMQQQGRFNQLHNAEILVSVECCTDITVKLSSSLQRRDKRCVCVCFGFVGSSVVTSRIKAGTGTWRGDHPPHIIWETSSNGTNTRPTHLNTQYKLFTSCFLSNNRATAPLFSLEANQLSSINQIINRQLFGSNR